MDPAELLTKKPLVDEYLRRFPQSLSAFSFASIYAWCDFFRFEILKMDGALCIFAHHTLGTFLYLPPLTDEIPDQLIERCFQHMEKTKGADGFARIENVPESMLPGFAGEKYRIEPKSDEYIYAREDIAGLKGNRYKSKRSDLHHFENRFGGQWVPMQERHVPDCLTLYETWAADRIAKNDDDIYRAMIEENRQVHERVLKAARETDLIARVILVGNKVSGYSAAYRLNKDMLCILFEITDLGMKGSGVFAFQRMCADPEAENIPFINCMDDFGMLKISHTKKSFHPKNLVSSYVVSLRP